MKMYRFSLATLAAMAFAAHGASAAEMSASATAPVVDGADIANYGAATGTDKWWPENSAGAGSAKGQTFTTGDLKVKLKSITYQISDTQQAEPTKTYTIRICTISGNELFEIHSETAVQDFKWNSGEYMTWTLAEAVQLEANTVYAIDVAISSSTSSWQTGIPYITTTGNSYAGGSRYTSGRNGAGSPQINYDTRKDRVFHIDLEYLPHGFQFILE